MIYIRFGSKNIGQLSLKKFNIFIAIWLLVVIPNILLGQNTLEKEVDKNSQFWTSINSTFRMSDRWGAMADFHIRRENFIKDPNFYFLRFGGVYWLDDKFSAAGGVAGLWLATDTEAGLKYAFEKRIFQQVLWRSQIKKITFLQRIRVEQRWHEVLDRATGEVDRVRYSNRFRFLMSASVQVFENPQLPKLVIADEIHFHTGKEIIFNTFDQNRLFVGINQRLSKSVTFDMGYMMVYQQRYSGYQYDLNNTFRLFFYFSPDWRKKGSLPHYAIAGEQ